ncbi:MAG TPA: hypothetical protein VGL34_03415 [Steroidobacteraceae bacterium]|jgi:hypothetical protein
MTKICSQCGTAGDSKTRTSGSILIELVLWCCFIVPGLIYSLWRLSSRKQVCRACGAASFVPLSSPVGQRLAATYGLPKESEGAPKGSAQRGLAWMAIGVAILVWAVWNAVRH